MEALSSRTVSGSCSIFYGTTHLIKRFSGIPTAIFNFGKWYTQLLLIYPREGSYIQRISPFFDLTLDQEEIEVGWSAQKVSNMIHMLQVVRTLVSPSNNTQVASTCQTTIQQCGLLGKLCETLMASGIPADILTETINALSETIRGHPENQTIFGHVTAPSSPPRSALILLLMAMVNEKQPFALR